MDAWLNPFVAPLSGLLVGLMVGATGVGGGAVMTPLLVLMLGVAPQTAIGTDLLYASVTKLTGAGVHGAQGRIDWQIVRRLASGSLPSALATLLWLRWARPNGIANGAIILAVGLAMLFTALAMILKPLLVGLLKRQQLPGDSFRRWQPALTVLAGAMLGCLVALTSIGAGALGALMLVVLYPQRLGSARLAATDMAHAIPLALVAGAGHLLLGNVDFTLLGQLLAGSIPGAWIGAHFGGRWPDQVLRTCMALILASVGLRLVV